MEALLDFDPVFECGTVISTAAPFYGAHATVAWPARVLTSRQLRMTPELRSLQRVARQNETTVAPELRESYVAGLSSSLTTLRPGQLVIRAATDVPMASTVRHVAIAGVGGKAGRNDDHGIVPSTSSLHAGAELNISLQAIHDAQQSERVAVAVIDEILRLSSVARCVSPNSKIWSATGGSPSPQCAEPAICF